MQPAQRQVLEDLRERIRRLERKPGRASGGVESGWPSVDALLPGGGFPRGAIAELTGCAGSGKTAIAVAVVARAMGECALAAWIDARSELYAPAVQLGGVDLDRLLIVRPGAEAPLSPSGATPMRGVQASARQSLWATEAVLGSGAFAAVVVDVPLAAGARATTEWGAGASAEAMLRRLVAAAEKGGATCIWLSEPGSCAPPARLRIEVSRGRDGIRARPVPRGASGTVAGHAA
jgi:protein ImuA